MTNKTTVAGIDFSEADIMALKEGQQIGGSSKTGLASSETQTFKPQVSHPIGGHRKDIRPVIREASGEVIKQDLVTKPDISRHQAAHEEAMAKLELLRLEREQELQDLRAFMEPAKLRSEIQYLQRQVLKLEKSLKKLTAEAKTNGE